MSGEAFVENLMDDVVALEERVDDIDGQLSALEDLQERVERLEQRTDMLRLIEEADELDAHQRSAALWQHCVRKAETGRREQIVLDRDDAEAAMHYPDIDRTTVYTDMERVERLVGDERVAEYVAAGESETDQAELRVDLSTVSESVDASTLLDGGE